LPQGFKQREPRRRRGCAPAIMGPPIASSQLSTPGLGWKPAVAGAGPTMTTPSARPACSQRAVRGLVDYVAACRSARSIRSVRVSRPHTLSQLSVSSDTDLEMNWPDDNRSQELGEAINFRRPDARVNYVYIPESAQREAMLWLLSFAECK